MLTIRQEGGLSGFAKISESDHDTFGAGHASTALSAGLGVVLAEIFKVKIIQLFLLLEMRLCLVECHLKQSTMLII